MYVGICRSPYFPSLSMPFSIQQESNFDWATRFADCKMEIKSSATIHAETEYRTWTSHAWEGQHLSTSKSVHSNMLSHTCIRRYTFRRCSKPMTAQDFLLSSSRTEIMCTVLGNVPTRKRKSADASSNASCQRWYWIRHRCKTISASNPTIVERKLGKLCTPLTASEEDYQKVCSKNFHSQLQPHLISTMANLIVHPILWRLTYARQKWSHVECVQTWDKITSEPEQMTVTSTLSQRRYFLYYCCEFGAKQTLTYNNLHQQCFWPPTSGQQCNPSGAWRSSFWEGYPLAQTIFQCQYAFWKKA